MLHEPNKMQPHFEAVFILYTLLAHRIRLLQYQSFEAMFFLQRAIALEEEKTFDFVIDNKDDVVKAAIRMC